MISPPVYNSDFYNVTHHIIANHDSYRVAYMYNRKEPIILFGLQGLINELMNTKFYLTDAKEANDDAYKNGAESYFDMWYVLDKEFHGDISKVLKISQVPELCWYPAGTPLAKIENIDPRFPQLVTYFEGYLTKCFYPSLMLTKLYEYKRAGIQNLHNFGYRSYPSEEIALRCSLAFSMLYDGTDNFHVNRLKRVKNSFYEPYAEIIDKIKPKSIIALNHEEVQAYRDEIEMIVNVATKGKGRYVAMPIDTYDSDEFIENNLHIAMVHGCHNNTSFFFRIDSGDHILQCLRILDKIIAFKKANCLLNKTSLPKFGVIIGDHLDLEAIKKIIAVVKEWIFKRDLDINIWDYVYFGLGGKLLEGISRDAVGMVTKLAWTDQVGNTMKTAQGKESLTGKDLEICLQGKDYLVYQNGPFINLYNEKPIQIQNYTSLKSGAVKGYGTSLVIGETIKHDQAAFKKKMGLEK